MIHTVLDQICDAAAATLLALFILALVQHYKKPLQPPGDEP